MAVNLLGLRGYRLDSHRLPDGEVFQSILLAELQKVASSEGDDLKSVMIRFLENGIWPAGLRSNRGAWAAADQITLLQSGVAIIGAGGLGGMVVQGLSRAGVGRLQVCDGDRFDESNLNRQLLSRLDTLGRNKALCAGEAVKDINPAITVHVFDRWATPENLPDILEGCQVAVDCLDNLEARYQLQAACRKAGIPFIFGSINGWEGFTMTLWPSDLGLEHIFGLEDQNGAAGFVQANGVPSFTPALVASLQISQTIKLLLGHPGMGRGAVFHVDAGIPSIELLQLPDA